jgi:hypothetical protein
MAFFAIGFSSYRKRMFFKGWLTIIIVAQVAVMVGNDMAGMAVIASLRISTVTCDGVGERIIR